jgi:hypothetical protein
MDDTMATPDDQRAIFAEEFLRTGSPKQASRAAKIPERTGYRLANELEEDAEFMAARGRLHTTALARAEAAVIRSIDVLSDRIENATELLGNEDEGVKVLDKSADYGRAIASLNDSLLKRRKLEDDVAARQKEAAPPGPLEVVIRRAGTDKPSE